jgi:predicted Zn-dependent protease
LESTVIAVWSRCSCFVLCLGWVFAFDAQAAPPIDDLRTKLRAGEYEAVIRGATQGIGQRQFGEDWYLVKADAELALGRYQDAWKTVQAGLQRYAWSIRLRAIGIPAARFAGDSERAIAFIAEIQDLAGRAAWRYSDAENLIALGRVALLAGADARAVLETFYDPVLQQYPTHREALLAAGELALAKHDADLAAELFSSGIKHYPDDAELQFGLARSLAASHSDQANLALQAALKANPRHVAALLFRVESLIDQERYEQAGFLLEKIDEVNSRHPQAYAYRSILATLKNDPKGADLCRDYALCSWQSNPAVDHLIGRMLSRKYRFAEGAAHQQQALAFDPKYLPSKMQLAQDWLRLGREDEGWNLAQATHEADGYDVQMFNLLALRDALAKFATLEEPPFIVRMEAQEAKIYGRDVLALLQRAKERLAEKYGWAPQSPIIVEIFPRQNDFAVRTFGMPGVSGFLGVCFGTVITANSPASQRERPSNGQSVLWHEFCHVVTLELTRHRIPRWLSEGISVYEEHQADPSWGQPMNPDDRERILSGRLTPIRQLSGAFLNPESSRDLQFAYFESSLVVDFLVRRYGFAALQAVLHDLAAGLPIEQALERHASDLDQFDAEFRADAAEQAKQLGYGLDWEEYDLSAILDDDDPDRLDRWLDDHPTSLRGLLAKAKQAIEARDWEAAIGPLEKLIELYPEQTGADSAYVLLAAVHRQREDIAAERKLLEDYVLRDDAPSAELFRLLELQQDAEDWPAVMATVQRLRGIQPLSAAVHRSQAAAAEHLKRWSDAVAALEASEILAPDDPADLHYRLGRAYHQTGSPAAKRRVLMALELAPRYQAAQELLLEIVDQRAPVTENR